MEIKKEGGIIDKLTDNWQGINTKPRQWNGGETPALMQEKFNVMAIVRTQDNQDTEPANHNKGPFLATMHFLPLLQKSETGKILNVTSELGSISGMFFP
jgi:NAD(P)-dependent dehydrogenase (short-subunit alcohol dehydrogenase family)